MILTHEDFSKIAQSIGAAQAQPIIDALEKLDREARIEVKRDLLIELATKADIAELKGEIRRIEAELKVYLKVLIGLTALAIAFFSPVGTEIIKLLAK